MSVASRDIGGVLIIHPEHERITVASGSVEDLRESLHQAVDDGRLAIAIDLDGVEYIDSAVVGVLADEFGRLAWHHGRLCLFNVHPALHEFFSHTVLDHLIPVCGSEEAVIELFRGKHLRRRLPNAFRNALSSVYSVGYKIGMVSERRSPGKRRSGRDRRVAVSPTDEAAKIDPTETREAVAT
jgi:anti-anti-sigma factor